MTTSTTDTKPSGIVIPEFDEAWAMIEKGTDEEAALIRREAAKIKAVELDAREIIAKHVESLINKGIMDAKASSVVYHCKWIQNGNKKLISLKLRRSGFEDNVKGYWMEKTGNTVLHVLTGRLGQNTIQDGDA